jgi:prepilin peptidase CpaA
MALALAIAAIALFATAAVTDSLNRRIPNRVSIALALVGLVRIAAALMAGESALTAGLDLAAAVAVFTLAALAFRFGLLGGGDVKLLAAGTLWLGAAALGPYLLTTVLAGGLLAVAFVAGNFALPKSAQRLRPSLPDAVAIAAGGILTTTGALWA